MHEEEVKLRAPLKLDPGDTVVVNHRLDDVVVLIFHTVGMAACASSLAVGAATVWLVLLTVNLRVWWGVTPTRLTLTRLLAVPLDTNLLR